MSATKYAYGNGDPGCLFDHASGPYDTAEDAVQAASDLLELSEEEAAELLADRIVYFRGDRKHEVGAGLVEVFEVDEDWESGEY